jgi:hypothetical protein
MSNANCVVQNLLCLALLLFAVLCWLIGRSIRSHLSSFILSSSVSCQLNLKALLTSTLNLTVAPSPDLHGHHFQGSSWGFSASTAALCINTTGSLLLVANPSFRAPIEAFQLPQQHCVSTQQEACCLWLSLPSGLLLGLLSFHSSTVYQHNRKPAVCG